MPDKQIRQYAQEKRFHTATLERWLSWSESDQEALLGLALALQIGENHLRDLIDWLEEISLRDGAAIRELLTSQSISDIKTDPRLGRADRLKRIKDQIRRLRFPRLSATEDRIQSHIRDLRLGPRIKLSVPPGLEGGRLYVEFHASTREELEQMISMLADAAKARAMAEIFTVLAGERSPGTEIFSHPGEHRMSGRQTGGSDAAT